MIYQKYVFAAFVFFGSILLSIFQVNAAVISSGNIDYVANDHQVKTFNGTYITDYNTSLYYKAGIEAQLYDEFGDYDYGFEVNPLAAEVHCEVQSTFLRFHHWDAVHFIRSRSSGPVFYDPFGYSSGKEKPELPTPDPDNLKDSAKPTYNLANSNQSFESEYKHTDISTSTNFADYPLTIINVDAFVGMNPQINAFSPTGLPVGSGGPILMRFVGPDLSPEQRSGYVPTINVTGAGVTAVARPASVDYTGLDVEITVAENAEIGDHQISITLPDLLDGTVTSNQLPFRIGDNSPIITNISEEEGDTGEVLQVTIDGTGFGLSNLLLFDGGGIGAAIQSQTSTQIVATFAIGDNAPPGERGVKVKSFGRSGTGFILVPGNTDTSNAVPFNVIAQPKVTFPEIGSVEKGSVKMITAQVENAPPGHVTKFEFKNKIYTTPCPLTGCETGEARFENGTPNGATEFICPGMGDYQCQIPIRGWERSSSKDNVDIEARFNNNRNRKKEKSFSVSSVEFTETAECNGYDNVEAIKNNGSTTYLSLPRGGSKTVKAKVVPSGATGDFKLEVIGGNGISVSPLIINSTNEVTVTVSATATALRNSSEIHVKANNIATTTTKAEVLAPYALKRIDKVIKIYKVKEDNDDVQAIPVGQGTPNSVAYVFSEGANGFIDTVAGGDDWLAPVPIGQRPPGYSPRSRRVITGANGILETLPQGDDEIYSSTDESLMQLYAPVTVVGNGLTGAICITRGTNDFLDTWDRNGDDEEVPDPADSTKKLVAAGTNGRCQTHANNTDIPASNPPSVATIEPVCN